MIIYSDPILYFCYDKSNLFPSGLEHRGLLRVTGSLKKVIALKAKYDGGESVDLTQEGDVDTVASLLKLCLKELPEGVIPESAQSSFIIVYKGKYQG